VRQHKIIRVIIAGIGFFTAVSLSFHIYRFCLTPGTPRWAVPHLAAVLALIVVVVTVVFFAAGTINRKR